MRTGPASDFDFFGFPIWNAELPNSVARVQYGQNIIADFSLDVVKMECGRPFSDDSVQLSPCPLSPPQKTRQSFLYHVPDLIPFQST